MDLPPIHTYKNPWSLWQHWMVPKKQTKTTETLSTLGQLPDATTEAFPQPKESPSGNRLSMASTPSIDGKFVVGRSDLPMKVSGTIRKPKFRSANDRLTSAFPLDFYYTNVESYEIESCNLAEAHQINRAAAANYAIPVQAHFRKWWHFKPRSKLHSTSILPSMIHTIKQLNHN